MTTPTATTDSLMVTHEGETVFDLTRAIFDKIEEIGPDAAAAYFKVSKTIIAKWQGGTAQPGVGAAQRVLDEACSRGMSLPAFTAAPEQGQTIPEPSLTLAAIGQKRTTTDAPKPVDPVKIMEKARTFAILSPINREMSYATVLSMLGNWKATLPEPIRGMLAHMDFEPDTTPHMARNRLATRFLEKGDEWSFWMDSDIIASIGNPGWFKRRTGSRHSDQWFSKAAINQLSSHPGKRFVGAVYSQRSADRRLVCSPGMTPKSEGEKLTAEEIRDKGPQDKIAEVEWIGFGCVAVHRQVFLDILERVPNVKASTTGQAHEFFTPISGGNEGEDMAFCKRARQAGHPPFMDLSVHCGHIGKFAFMP